MADGITVDMQGADNTITLMGNFAFSTVAKVQRILERNAGRCADDAQPPVDTGELRDSKYVLIGDLWVEVGFDSDHAAYVELGTRNMAAQPYLLPAFVYAEQQLLFDLDTLY
jgi:hypothetical protein